MSKTERVELTTLCLVYHEDRILLQNRIKADWQGWTLPGGHIEPDESIVEAVRREVYEESGLTIFNPELRGIKQFPIEGGRYLVFLFRANEFTGELSSSEEGQMKWFARSELPNLNTVGDFDELLSVIDGDHLSEFLYVLKGSDWQVVLK